jgi:hypothetical protein
MRKSSVFGLALACGAIGVSPAFASVQAAATTQQQSGDIEVTGNPEKKICVRESAVGTRLAQRTCLTASQWKAREEQNEHERHRSLDQMNSAPTEKMLPGEPVGPS